jgi:hypothetical protein
LFEKVTKTMTNQRQPTTWFIFSAMAILLLILGACGQPAVPPAPTRTPMPTFTPSPSAPQEPTADPNVVATTQAAAIQATQQAEQAAQAAQATQAAQAAPPTNTPEPPTPTPLANPEVVANDQINVRQGPGTNYNIIGAAARGERFKVTGKNQDGSWWQIDYQGQPGWLFGQLVAAQNTGAVQVAQNIPAPPPPTNTPVPQPTPTPGPTQPPAPPKSTYKFNIVVVSRCERQPAGNWFEGTTYVNSQPQNGFWVAFSYAPDGPIVAKILSGPHEGYPGWKTGYYSHIINAPQTGPKAGNWFVWVVDENNQRISEIGNWQSTGPGEGCNQAVVDFDSRP